MPTHASTPLSDITVHLMNGAVEVTSGISTASGTYNLSSMDDGTYTLTNTTARPWLPCNGLDVIIEKRFIAGLVTFTPLEIIAGDVNKTGAPDGLDVIMMKRRIAGHTYPAWTAADYIFELQSVTVTGGIGSKNYQSLCTGDVNGSNTP